MADAVRQAGGRHLLIAPGCTFDPAAVPPENLRAIRRAVETPGLWKHLREGIPAAHPMADHAAVLTQAYRSLPQPELHQILVPREPKSDAVRSEDPEAVA